MIASAVKGRGGRGETRQQADRWMERKDSGVEDDDPFSQQTLELGLGTDSRLQKETVVLDISMEKRLDRHWQARWVRHVINSTLLAAPFLTFRLHPGSGAGNLAE